MSDQVKPDWQKLQPTTIELPAKCELDENGVWTVIVSIGVLGPFPGIGTGYTLEEAKEHCVLYLKAMAQHSYDCHKALLGKHEIIEDIDDEDFK